MSSCLLLGEEGTASTNVSSQGLYLLLARPYSWEFRFSVGVFVFAVLNVIVNQFPLGI